MNLHLLFATLVLLVLSSTVQGQTPNPTYVSNAEADLRVRLWGHVYNANHPLVAYRLQANLTHNQIGEHDRLAEVDGLNIWDDSKFGLYIEEKTVGPQAWDNSISRFLFEAQYETMNAGPPPAVQQHSYFHEVPASKSIFVLPGHRSLKAYGDESYIYDSTPDTVYIDVGVTYAFSSDHLLDEAGNPMFAGGLPVYGDQYGTELSFSLRNWITNDWDLLTSIEVGDEAAPFSGTLEMGAHEMLVQSIDRTDGEYTKMVDGDWIVRVRAEFGNNSNAVREFTLTPWQTVEENGPNGGLTP